MMSVECLFVWAWCWLCLDLISKRYVATQLATILSFLLLLVCFLLINGLDLLGLFIASTYSSVFIAITLLALQFGPFWALATVESDVSPYGLRFGLLFIVSGLIISGWSCVWLEGSWDGWVLWQDCSADLLATWPLQSGILHWLFFRGFILETIGLNLYLFLALVGVLFFINLRWVLDTRAGEMTSPIDSLLRLRLVARPRRQTRRTNASQLRLRP
jgi:hypothetical protein